MHELREHEWLQLNQRRDYKKGKSSPANWRGFSLERYEQMPRLEQRHIREILAEKRFVDLKDAIETDEIDFKDQPYGMDSDRQKYALVEDVTAMANHEGGVIVIGCRTTAAQDIEGDEVVEIRPMPLALCKFEIWRSICNTLIYPPIRGLNFEFYELEPKADEIRGLAAIWVPKGPDSDRPHLLTHILNDEDDRKITTKYGLVIRTGARNAHYAVTNVHALIQSGSAVSKVERSLSSIEIKLAELLKDRDQAKVRSKSISLSRNRKSFAERIPEFLASFGRENHPTLVLGAFPSEEITVNEIYDSTSPVARAFDNPPSLRPSGFGLYTGREVELAAGIARVAINRQQKARLLSNSGKLLVGVPADEDFLGWATNRRPGYPLRYRSFVLAEVTYIFAAYVQSIFDRANEKPSNLDIFIALRNCFIENIPPQLGVAADHGHFHHSWIDPKSSPKMNLLKSLRVPIDIPVERLAFEIRACLYRRFGFDDSVIPYSTLREDGRVTLSEHILNPNQQ
jgi:hypothetical protein